MIFYLIALYFIQSYIYSYITIPFKREFYIDNLQNKTIFDELLLNNLKISIKIGKPFQEIPFYLNLREYAFFINSNYFNINNSNTYKKLIVDEYEHFYEYIDGINDISYYVKKKTIESSDQIKIGKENLFLNNISFLIYNKTYKNYGILGLNQYYEPKYYKDYNIINQLKEQNIINSYSFFIEYINENDGNLFIGGDPHEIFKTKYDYKYFNVFPKNTISEGFYKVQFDKILFNNDSLVNDLNAEISIENGMIRGTNTFKNLIEKNFFEQYIKQNLCFKINNTVNEYDVSFYYYCEKKVINNFPSLNFQINDSRFIFTLDKDDLFFNYKDKSYFLIYFKNVDLNKWILGKPFFKKYLLIFNQDKKTISYYIKLKNKSFNFKFTSLSIFLNIFFIIIIIILSYYIYYYFKYKIRKIRRANELIEDDENNNRLNINQQYIEL